MPRRRARRRLVLYSGGQERRNALLHEGLLDLCHTDEPIRMTYLPFCREQSAVYFRRFERRYRSYGAAEFDCVCVDDPANRRDPAVERRILRSHVVYLAGGNTFYFLMHLRRSGLMPVLRRFVAAGGVIAGLSAGALILTPEIGLAGYPSFDCDENEVGLRDLRALRLVEFEFFPHYVHSRRVREALLRWSEQRDRPVYACRDGSGVVVHDDRFTAHGEVFLFHRGQMLKLGA